MGVLEKHINTLPSLLNIEANENINALLTALAASDDEVSTQISNAKDQLFIRTATGNGLVRAASDVGVSKPLSIGLLDSTFQELIPNLSLKPKQIKKAFYDTAEVFWGPLYSHANLTSLNAATYNLTAGDELKVRVDSGEIQTIVVRTSDYATSGALTALEVVAILDRIVGATGSIVEDAATGDQYVNLRTDTVGSVGGLELFAASGFGASKLDLALGVHDILDLSQRFVVYNVNYNELIIEIPGIFPIVRRVLRGSHHFHENSTLEGPVAPENGIWAGSFLFDPNAGFTVTQQAATITTTGVSAGSVITSLTVDDNSSFINTEGTLVFGFGLDEEVGVKYRGIPNTNTILIDPSHVFTKDHAIGTKVNVITQTKGYTPSTTGDDLPIYITAPSNARSLVEGILGTLKAAGIVIQFVVLAPEYKYLIDNPYLSSDDAPSV